MSTSSNVGTVTFNTESAGYQNAIGMYKIAADGTIYDVQIVFANASLKDDGGKLTSGDSVNVTVDAGENVGFFIIPNGYGTSGMSSILSSTNGSFSLVTKSGEVGNVNGGEQLKLVYTDAKGKATDVQSAYGTQVYLSSDDGTKGLNGDKTNHVAMKTAADGSVTIGFEDLQNGGDKDYNDTVITFRTSEAAKAAAAAAPVALGTQLLIDGSFEQAKVDNGTWSHQSVVGGWHSDTEIETWGKGFYGVTPTDGNKFVELDYDTKQSNIYQSVHTEAGAEYTFTFDYMKRSDSKAGSDTINVYWNNKLVGTVDPTDSKSWSKAEFKVVGTGGDDKIEFRESSEDNDSYGGLIDNASMKKSGLSTAEKVAAEKAAAEKAAAEKAATEKAAAEKAAAEKAAAEKAAAEKAAAEKAAAEKAAAEKAAAEKAAAEKAAAEKEAAEKAAAEKAAAEKAAAEKAAAEKAAAEKEAAEKAAAEKAAAEKAAAEKAAAEKAAAEKAAAEKAAAEKAAAEKAAAEKAAAEKEAAEKAAAEKAAAEKAAAEKAAAEKAAAEKEAAEKAAAEKEAAEKAAAEKEAAEKAAAEKAAAEKAAAEKEAAEKAAAEKAAAEKAAAEKEAAEKAAAEKAAAEKAAAEKAAAEKEAAEKAAAEKAAAEKAAAEKEAAEKAAAEKAAAEKAAAEEAAKHHAEDSLALKAADVAKGYTSEVVHGKSGDDKLVGGVGDDKLYGHDGDDVLVGDDDGRVTSPLDIAVSLVDADNSETLSLTLSGMPKGAELSAGKDNGDGTWSLSMDDLKGLTITADDRSNFQLHVVATAVDSWGGTMTEQADINVVLDTGNQDLLVGGKGNDDLTGNAGDDVMYGGSIPTGVTGKIATFADNDVIHGNDGNDVIYGNSGDDKLYGDAGNDFVSGGKGNDLVSGGDGDDIVKGNSGDDLITGDAGDDQISGGSGFDTLDYSMAANGMKVDLSQHTAVGMGNDTVDGIEKVIGSDFADTFVGDSHDNVFVGGGGDDTMRGGKGNDVLSGGDGNDTFVWAKSDVYNTKLQIGWVDHVTDFQVGDKLELSGFLKAGADVASMVRVTDGVDGTTVSVKFGGSFHDVVVLDNVHDLTANDMMKAGMLLVA